MKTLKTLIRLKKDEVDKLKKELTQLEERQQRLIDEHDALNVQMAHEAEVAAQFPECAGSFAAYVKKTLERQKNLKTTINLLQESIDKKRDELQLEFGELKKYEIALEQRQNAILNEAKRRDALKMDEVALRGFSRKDIK